MFSHDPTDWSLEDREAAAESIADQARSDLVRAENSLDELERELGVLFEECFGDNKTFLTQDEKDSAVDEMKIIHDSIQRAKADIEAIKDRIDYPWSYL